MNNGYIILPQGISRASLPRPHRGLTLIELIIVMGIIGVLSSVLIATFSGGTESARAAKCLNNMRSLAQGALSYAASSSVKALDRPLMAGSAAVIRTNAGGIIYHEHPGWISWLSMNDEYGTRRQNGHAPKSFVSLENASAYCRDRQKADFAITNGAIWQAVNCNRDVYTCPEHVIAVQKKNAVVNWSYVMNSYFGYDASDGSRGFKWAGNRELTDTKVRPERRLLFAELPIYGTGNRIDEGGKAKDAVYPTSSSTETDCVLQYKASSMGIKQSLQWNGTPETIAFNHKSGKRWCAHVVFADGHTEKLLKPKSGSGVSEEQLTILLCAAKDIGFDGSSYTWVNSTDKGQEGNE